ncbi:MAG: DUF2017 family protein [Acidimicrobiales bacterium]
MRLFRPRIRRTSDGGFDFGISDAERELVGGLLSQMQELLAMGDESLQRLFPPAYAADEERESEYRRLMGDELLSARFADLDVIEETLQDDRLQREQLEAWMRGLNGVRLVMGTRLDVTEDMGAPDPDDPDAALIEVYHYLSGLVDELVGALARD